MLHIEHKRVRQDYSHRPVPSVLAEQQRLHRPQGAAFRAAWHSGMV